VDGSQSTQSKDLCTYESVARIPPILSVTSVSPVVCDLTASPQFFSNQPLAIGFFFSMIVILSEVAIRRANGNTVEGSL